MLFISEENQSTYYPGSTLRQQKEKAAAKRCENEWKSKLLTKLSSYYYSYYYEDN